MAIANNREIFYSSMEYAELKLGKKIRSWKQDTSSLRIFFLFEDGTMGVLPMGMMLEGIEEIQPYDVPKSFCVSCGEEWHVSSFDDWGRCRVTVQSFWNKVRKIYWHRYIKNKK